MTTRVNRVAQPNKHHKASANKYHSNYPYPDSRCDSTKFDFKCLECPLLKCVWDGR